MILTLDVDGILITGKDEKVVGLLKKALTNRLAMTDMGEVSLILVMKVTRDNEQRTLSSSQEDCMPSSALIPRWLSHTRTVLTRSLQFAHQQLSSAEQNNWPGVANRLLFLYLKRIRLACARHFFRDR